MQLRIVSERRVVVFEEEEDEEICQLLDKN